MTIPGEVTAIGRIWSDKDHARLVHHMILLPQISLERRHRHICLKDII